MTASKIGKSPKEKKPKSSLKLVLNNGFATPELVLFDGKKELLRVSVKRDHVIKTGSGAFIPATMEPFDGTELSI